MSQRKPKLKPKEKTQPIYPFPELVAHTGGWEIDVVPESHAVGRACASRRRKHMTVPVDDTPRARSVRLHEMAHVKWSPSQVPPEALLMATHDSILAAEDARVNTCLNNYMGVEWIGQGLRNETFPSDLDDMRGLCRAKQKHGIGALLLARTNTGNAGPLARVMSEELSPEEYTEILTTIRQARCQINEDPLDFASAVAAARIIDALRPPPPTTDPYEGRVDQGARGLDTHDTDDLLEEVREVLKDGKPKGPGEHDFGGKVSWGRVVWEHPPLVRKVPMRKIGKSKRAYEEGCVPVNMHRLVSDGRIFSRKSKRFGGAVLIDQSGSMSLTPEQVESIVIAAPAVIVVGYCGIDSRGYMRVLAKNGKLVSEDDVYMPYGGNVIDYPALEWLAEQGEPRVWVSDAGVIGTGGSVADQRRQCAQIVRAKRIIRVNDADEAVEFLGNLR